MSDKRVTIVVEAKDQATGVLHGVGSALGDIGKIAIGGALAGGLIGIANGIGGIAKEAFGAVASQEKLGKSLETMLAREIVKQGTQTKTIQIGSQIVGVTEKQEAATTALASRVETLKAQLAVQNEHLSEAVKKGKESSAELSLRRNRIQNLNDELEKTNAKIAASPAPRVVGVFKTLTTQTVSLADAQRQAAEKTKDLLSWSEKLAIFSPFSQEDVAASLKMAMAYGFTSDEAKSLTEANINLASATGASGDTMQRVSLAFGQIRGKGKLMGQELLQLTEAGIPFRDILLDSGKVAGLTASNFDKMMEKGLIPAKAAMEAYTGYVQGNFATAAKDQAGTFAGLVSSLGDLKLVAERDFFGPIFRAAQPYLNTFVDALQNPAIRAQIQAIGADIGRFAVQVFTGLGQVASWVQTNWPQIQTAINSAFAGISSGYESNVAPILTGMIAGFSQVVGWVQTNWPQIQAVIGSAFVAIQDVVNVYVVPSVQFLISQFQQIVGWVQANWPLISATVSAVGQAIQNVINTVAPIITKVFGGAFESLKATVSTAVLLIEGILKAAMQVITGDWEGAWDTLKTTAENVWKGIQDFFNGLPKTMAQFGADLMNSFIASILGFKDRVLQVLKDIIANAFDNVKRALGIPVDVNVNSPAPTPGAGANYSAYRSIPSYLSGSAPSSSASARPTHERVPVQVDGRPLFYLFVDWMNREIHSEELRYG